MSALKPIVSVIGAALVCVLPNGEAQEATETTDDASEAILASTDIDFVDGAECVDRAIRSRTNFKCETSGYCFPVTNDSSYCYLSTQDMERLQAAELLEIVSPKRPSDPTDPCDKRLEIFERLSDGRQPNTLSARDISEQAELCVFKDQRGPEFLRELDQLEGRIVATELNLTDRIARYEEVSRSEASEESEELAEMLYDQIDELDQTLETLRAERIDLLQTRSALNNERSRILSDIIDRYIADRTAQERDAIQYSLLCSGMGNALNERATKRLISSGRKVGSVLIDGSEASYCWNEIESRCAELEKTQVDESVEFCDYASKLLNSEE